MNELKHNNFLGVAIEKQQQSTTIPLLTHWLSTPAFCCTFYAQQETTKLYASLLGRGRLER